MNIPFADLIYQVAGEVGAPSGLDSEGWLSLIPAVVQKESTFNPNAVSYTGAGIGLMQVNPSIWSSVWNVTKEQLFDPYTNLFIGSTILRDYINQFGVTGGLGAYFAGPNGRLTSAAKTYAQKVIGYWNGFKNALRRLMTPTVTSGSWFVDPATGQDVDLVSGYLANDSVYASDPFAIDLTGGIGAGIDLTTWLVVGAIAVLVFLVLE